MMKMQGSREEPESLDDPQPSFPLQPLGPVPYACVNGNQWGEAQCLRPSFNLTGSCLGCRFSLRARPPGPPGSMGLGLEGTICFIYLLNVCYILSSIQVAAPQVMVLLDL